MSAKVNVGIHINNVDLQENDEDSPLNNKSADSKHVLSQESFDKLHLYTTPSKTSRFSRNCTSRCFSLDNIFSVFPFFHWVRGYNFKRDLLADAIAGCTVGVMQIPQGLAISMLAGVPPITGLYMSFFPIFIYVLMGTSRHISIGTSILCIMAKSVIAAHAMPDTVDSLFPDPPDTSLSEKFIKPDNPELTSVQVAVVLCVAVGIWQILMAVLRLGKISVLLSDTLVSGFCTAAAVHGMTSQLGSLLGISVGKYSTDFKVILIVRDVVKNIYLINLISLAMSLSTMVVLIVFKEYLKPKIERKCQYPVPIEMICIVAGTLISKAFDLSSEYNVKCLGSIPKGLPTASVPMFWLLPEVLFASLPMALVGFTIALSVASIFAKQDHYKISANQEFAALGTANLFASFFSCAPVGASLSRSMLQRNVGGKTQVAGLFTSVVMLLVMLVIGKFFESLPHCVLGAIIMVILKNLVWQIKDVPGIWKRSKVDGVVWLGTFLVTVLWDIDYGLGVGLVLSILSILLYGQNLQIYPLGKVPDHDLYLDMRHYQMAANIPGIKIIHISGSLHFANKTLLRKKILKSLRLVDTIEEILAIIMDMSGVSFIDPAASECLAEFRDDFLKANKNSKVFLANCPQKIAASLTKFGYFSPLFLASQHLFPSVQDAVQYANYCR